jgi:phosphoglycolate phosphatase-like HAD superfamily hydrolase
MLDVKQFETVIFDLDGPLLDGIERHYFCYSEILRNYGYKPIPIDQYWALKRDMLNRHELLRLSGANNIYNEFLDAWLVLIESEQALALDKVQPGAIFFLEYLSRCGCELTLVTMRKNRSALEKQLQEKGLRKFLKHVLVCDHSVGGTGKADSVRSLLGETLNPDALLWIGDTEVDWEAGKSLGCKVILVANGLRSETVLNSLGNITIVPSIASLDIHGGPDEP